MSAIGIEGAAPSPRAWPWRLWARQVLALMRFEVKKSFWGRRALVVYLLALAPAGIMAVWALAPVPADVRPALPEMLVTYAAVFEAFILRIVIFFGCAALFTYLFRGDVLQRSLHYYFLAPVRREVLVVGKYVAGLVTAVALFGSATVLSYLLIYVPYGSSVAAGHLLDGPGLAHLAAYLGVAVLACMGYGALFLLTGLVFRNPFIPAGVLLGWESINFLLPALLKRLSVVYYLQSLQPVAVPDGLLALVAAPASPWVAVPGLLAFTVAALALAGVAAKRTEIDYGAD